MISLITLAIMAVWLLSAYAFFDVLMKPNAEFKAIGQSKYLWLVLIFVAGIIAALAYVLFVKPNMSKEKK